MRGFFFCGLPSRPVILSSAFLRFFRVLLISLLILLWVGTLLSVLRQVDLALKLIGRKMVPGYSSSLLTSDIEFRRLE